MDYQRLLDLTEKVLILRGGRGAGNHDLTEDEQENRLLAESGALSELLKQAQQEKPSPDWKKELREL